SLNPVVSAGIFTHAAATFDPATQNLKLYANGVEVASTLFLSNVVTSIVPSSTPVTIGATFNGSLVDIFDGLIDEVHLFNRDLSSAEIRFIYAAGGAGQCAPPQGAPVILVNGQFYGNNAITVSNTATVEYHSTFANGTIYFSLDGSNPNFGDYYTGPFTVSDSALIRAVAFNSNFTQSTESDPFTLTVVGPPLILQQPQAQVVVEGDAMASTCPVKPTTVSPSPTPLSPTAAVTAWPWPMTPAPPKANPSSSTSSLRPRRPATTSPNASPSSGPPTSWPAPTS
ncbi:MAG TPA: LamG-like jellyroll fold domain-containing protein, partial [Verrucomicrobiae bacterium]